MVDATTFTRNANAYPLEELRKLIGFNIAWSEDGTKILGYAKDLRDLYAQMEHHGIKDFVVQYLEDFCPLPPTPASAAVTANGDQAQS
jgi:hypothetical protein